MNVDPASPPGRVARSLRERLAVVLDWRSADKVILLSLFMLFFAVWLTAVAGYVIRYPESAPYVDRAHIEQALRAGMAVSTLWLALCMTAAGMRARWPNAPALEYAVAFLFTLTMLAAAYFLGTHTTLLIGVLVIGGVTIGLVMLDEPPVLAALGVGILGLAILTVADQAGVVPYAAVLARAPFERGKLSAAWLATIGSMSFAVLIAQLYIVTFVVRRWREREVMLARANDIISRYVASQLAEQIRAGNYDVLDRHERRRLTLFFSDIENFADTADHVEPEDLSEVLNEYLSEMAGIGERYGGTIDKFAGDAVMIFFGAPLATTDRDQALRAVQMAVEMQERMVALRDTWLSRGFEHPFHIRIGINTGRASIGNFGSQARADYTAIGRQVNLAARLQEQCVRDKILISHATWALVEGEIACEPKGEISVKGMRDPVKVYEVVASKVGRDRRDAG